MNTEPHENGTAKHVPAALVEIWEQYRDIIMGRVDVLDQAAVAALDAALDDDLRRKAKEEAHKLVGSVGTFGFGDGSGMARQIEHMLEGESPLSQDQILRLSELAVALRGVHHQGDLVETVVAAEPLHYGKAIFSGQSKVEDQ